MDYTFLMSSPKVEVDSTVMRNVPSGPRHRSNMAGWSISETRARVFRLENRKKMLCKLSRGAQKSLVRAVKE